MDPAPSAIGEVQFSWTNLGSKGTVERPWWVRLLPITTGALGGMGVGLVAFFVIGGIVGARAGAETAHWFLRSLGLGALAGVAVGVLLALRKPRMITCHVGKLGCAQILGGKPQVLMFTDVEEMRERVSSIKYKGIGSTARELLVRLRGEREKLWFVTSADPRDPSAGFIQAALRAYQKKQQTS
jgi:hypothetical protein